MSIFTNNPISIFLNRYFNTSHYIITNNTIHDFVKKYINNERHLLPPELQSIDIGQWNVSNVTNMHRLFFLCKFF
jgi:surface protein